MSDIRPTPPIKLDAAAKKRIIDGAAELEGLEAQVEALEKLGIIMPPIRDQLAFARKAKDTLLKDFT